MNELSGPMQARSGCEPIFRLETFSGKLIVDGREIALSPKSAQILECLIQHRGVIVSRKQVFAEAWPNQMVTDAALTQAISLLRRELGDAYRDCVRTIPRRGYVFNLQAAAAGPDAERLPTALEDIPRTEAQAEDAPVQVIGNQQSAYRYLPRFFLPFSLVASAGLSAFAWFNDKAAEPHPEYGVLVSENVKTGLADDIATLFHGDVDPTRKIDQSCEQRFDQSGSRQNRLFLDTTGFYANPLSDIPFSICMWNGEKIEMIVGKSNLGALYSTLSNRLHGTHADDSEKNVVVEGEAHSQSIDAYSAARDLSSAGLLFKAARQYETAFLKHPDQMQIAIDYADSLAAISETTRARLIYGSVISSSSASVAQRSFAAVAVAEIEGRFGDAAAQLKQTSIDDKVAVRLFENYYKSSDLDAAQTFVSALREGQISLDTKRYLDARMLALAGRRQASNSLLSKVLSTADENLYPDVVWALVSNHHAMFGENPDKRSLDSARLLLRDLEVFYFRRQNYAENLRVRQKSLIMALPLSDACTLRLESDALLQQARKTGAPVLTARALQLRSWMHYRCGDIEDSERDITDALDVMKNSSDVRRTAVMRLDYAFILMSQQRLDEAKSQLAAVRLLGADDAMRDSMESAGSRIERIAGNLMQAKHPCDAMLSALDDRIRHSLLGKCIGVDEVTMRSPDSSRFHGFMQSLHGMLAVTQCREERCALPDAKRWADEIRSGEPTPRRMMLEDFIFACSSLPGMCDSPEIRSVLGVHLSRWRLGTMRVSLNQQHSTS
jgi:DNA-binding winged helix-turn-helix (wHTH) protein